MTTWRCVLVVALSMVSQVAWCTPLEELFTAASVDNLRDVRRLVQDRVVDPKALNARGDTLLIAAIRDDAVRVTAYLIAEKGTDLDAADVSNETAMMIAAYRGRKDVVDQLLARGAEVNRPGWTALHYAASVGANDVVDLLIEHSAYLDAASPNRTTPLMMAARGGFGETAHRLVEAGADPTPTNERDLTAADFARRANSRDLADWLDAQSTAWRAKYGTSSGTSSSPPPRPVTPSR